MSAWKCPQQEVMVLGFEVRVCGGYFLFVILNIGWVPLAMIRLWKFCVCEVGPRQVRGFLTIFHSALLQSFGLVYQ